MTVEDIKENLYYVQNVMSLKNVMLCQGKPSSQRTATSSEDVEYVKAPWWCTRCRWWWGREKTADEWFSLTPINKIIRPSLVPIYSPGVSLYSHHVNHLFMLSPPACLPLITKRRSLIINWKGIGAITGEEEEEEHHQQRAQEHVPRNLIIVIASKARDSFFRV